jgi:hypothetical protein
MGKRSQQSKEKRKAEHERKKRWGQQQKTLHANQLMRDLAYYEERGLFTSQAKWSETASQVLWDSQNWRTEPEFRDLAFDPYQTGQAMSVAWQELRFDPEEFDKLSDEVKDDRNFELNARAIELNLGPEFKKDFLRRLERYRQRLRIGRQWEALAQAGLMQMILETSDQSGEAAWPECMLVYQVHYEAVGDYLRLQEAAETALEQALQTIGQTADAPDASLTDEKRAQLTVELEQAAQRTPGLWDFLERAADDLVDDALNAVRQGEVCFNLFTSKETSTYFAYFLSALLTSGASRTMPEDLSPQERANVDKQIDEAVAECLDQIDTPQRRAELYAAARAALQQLQAAENADSPATYADLLLPLLDDADVPLADNDFFVAAISSEFGREWDAELAADERDDDLDAAP